MPHADPGVRRAYQERYRQGNKERLAALGKKWAQDNPERVRECARLRTARWRAANAELEKQRVAAAKAENPDAFRSKAREATRRWRINNPEAAKASWTAARRKPSHKNRTKETWKRQYNENPSFRLAQNLRNRMRCALTRAGTHRSGRFLALVGCTPAELKEHIERQFVDGMTWANRSDWHIDHIIPCAAFDLTKSDQRRACFHYTNLKPLWAAENLRKGIR
jgi:hypothetical protein